MFRPTGDEAKRVVPERVDLHRLASPRRDDPAVHLCIHPGELVALGALANQPVGGVHTDAEQRALRVGVDDRLHHRQQLHHQIVVAGRETIPLHGVKEPERRVGRVIEPFAAPVGEHVGDQSIANVVREGAKDQRRLAFATGRQRQPLETDHRVTSPVGEPVVAGDDRANFVAECLGTGRIGDAAGRRDDELIGGENQLDTHRVLHVFVRGVGQPATTLQLAGGGIGRGQRGRDLDALGRRDECDGRVGPQFHDEVSGAPQRALRLVTPRLLHREFQLAAPLDVGDELDRRVIDAHAQPRQILGRRHAQPSVGVGQLIQVGDGRVALRHHRLFVSANVQRWPKLQLDGVASQQAIGDVNRVLSMWHQQPLLHARAVAVHLPDRQARFESKGDEMGCAFGMMRKIDLRAGARRHRLVELIEHHHSPDRIGQRGNQNAVIPTGVRSGDRA